MLLPVERYSVQGKTLLCKHISMVHLTPLLYFGHILTLQSQNVKLKFKTCFTFCKNNQKFNVFLTFFVFKGKVYSIFTSKSLLFHLKSGIIKTSKRMNGGYILCNLVLVMEIG